jgi:hypothetical protein
VTVKRCTDEQRREFWTTIRLGVVLALAVWMVVTAVVRLSV